MTRTEIPALQDVYKRQALYQSALCRQRADWLVGINATRLFSVLYHRTLNVGRVQTPTLSLLATRDAKIALFQKEKYHHVRLTLASAEAVSERFTDPVEAEQAAAMCKGAAVICTSVTKEQKKEQPPKLYDLTTLQREANRLLGYTAKQTLDYAQSLYEKRLLTYPRTDSRHLTSDMAETASCVIHLAAKLPPFAKIKMCIRDRGSDVLPFVFPACGVGAWHERQRTFIVAADVSHTPCLRQQHLSLIHILWRITAYGKNENRDSCYHSF